MNRIAELLADDRGATTTEYVVIASLISIVAIGAVMSIGTSVSAMFASIASGF